MLTSMCAHAFCAYGDSARFFVTEIALRHWLQRRMSIVTLGVVFSPPPAELYRSASDFLACRQLFYDELNIRAYVTTCTVKRARAQLFSSLYPSPGGSSGSCRSGNCSTHLLYGLAVLLKFDSLRYLTITRRSPLGKPQGRSLVQLTRRKIPTASILPDAWKRNPLTVPADKDITLATLFLLPTYIR
jgi:hypothetical protein